MTAAKLQRFDMGMLRDFRAPLSARAVTQEDAAPPPPPPPMYSEAQIDAAKTEAKKSGYQEGFIAGGAEENPIRRRKQASVSRH